MKVPLPPERRGLAAERGAVRPSGLTTPVGRVPRRTRPTVARPQAAESSSTSTTTLDTSQPHT